MSRGVAVVTGGSAGLGRAVVRELAAKGYDVAVLARGADGLEGAVVDVEELGRRGLGIPTDVAEHLAVEAAAEQIERDLGPIDIWVNDTMAGVFAEFLATTPADFERATAVSYLGTVNGTRAALTRMTRRDRGSVVQIGSAIALRGIPLQASYCGAKSAIVTFTESVVTELRHQRSHVRVSVVHMPAMNTPQFGWVRSQLPHHAQPVPPIYQPEVGARAVVAVAEHPRRTTWVGYPTVGVILGNRLVPGLLDRYLALTGYGSQQDQDLPAAGRDNLYDPLPGDAGAHGIFDDGAKTRSPLTTVALAKGRAVGGVTRLLDAVTDRLPRQG